MTIDRTAITREDAAHVLAWAGLGGYSGGGFVTALLHACSCADDTHLAKLALGYPGLVAAYRLYSREAGGLEWLQQITA